MMKQRQVRNKCQSGMAAGIHYCMDSVQGSAFKTRQNLRGALANAGHRRLELTFIGFQHRAHVVDGKVDERADTQRQPALRGIDDVSRQLSGLPLG